MIWRSLSCEWPARECALTSPHCWLMNSKYSKPQHSTSDLQSNKESQALSLRQSAAATSQSNTILHTHIRTHTPFFQKATSNILFLLMFISVCQPWFVTGEDEIRMTSHLVHLYIPLALKVNYLGLHYILPSPSPSQSFSA